MPPTNAQKFTSASTRAQTHIVIISKAQFNMAGMSFMKKKSDEAPKAPKEKKEKKVKAPKEKKEKAPKDPNAPKKNFLGREKKTPRSELQAEIDRLNQEVASKDQELADKTSELDAMKKWASSSPVTK
jgi:hypothetical protein